MSADAAASGASAGVSGGASDGSNAAPLRLALPTSADAEALGRALAGIAGAGDLIVLTGPLGAGKTTLTRGLGEGLGVRGPVASPTFVVARTHPSLRGGPGLVHVDAYRLRDPLELEDLDLDVEANVVVMEWGADAVSVLGDSWLELVLERPHGSGGAAGDDTGAVDAADADAEDEELEDAPRTAELRPVGAAWTTPERLAALAALAAR